MVKNLFIDIEKEKFYTNREGVCELYEDLQKYADYIKSMSYDIEDLDYMRFFFFETENAKKAHAFFLLKWQR